MAVSEVLSVWKQKTQLRGGVKSSLVTAQSSRQCNLSSRSPLAPPLPAPQHQHHQVCAVDLESDLGGCPHAWFSSASAIKLSFPRKMSKGW